jgi:protein FAM50
LVTLDEMKAKQENIVKEREKKLAQKQAEKEREKQRQLEAKLAEKNKQKKQVCSDIAFVLIQIKSKVGQLQF